MEREYAFEMATSSIRYGPGVTREVGLDLAETGARRVMVLTDPRLASAGPAQTVLESLEQNGIRFRLFDQVRIEPTDASLQEAIAVARSEPFEAFVAVGGGSTLDTAKAANLYSTYPPGDFLDYVNAPIGQGLPVPGPLKPLYAIPTTAGTGSETTGVAIFDLAALHAKTGIAHRRLKPTLGLIDPENTRTMPRLVAASTGLDVLTHAIESYTALPFHQRPRPGRPILRPAYQGANPISDVWSWQAARLVDQYLIRAVENPEDDEARGRMLLAASYAGVGFGNAGVTLPHGMSYPVSGLVKAFQPAGYPEDRPLIPHGLAVVLNAPAAFRFTAPADPPRHLEAAAALGAQVEGARLEDAGDILAERIIYFMRRLGVPNGLSAVGYTEADIPGLVQGALPQHRVLKLSPRPVNAEDLASIFRAALRYW
ncbi:MAG: hydroxyacid-oxoacid transhydrogenase [Thermodesulfobacteriota bacterium]